MAIHFNPSYGDAGTYTPDNLINGDFRIVRTSVEVEGNLKRGSVLAKNEAGKHALVSKGKEGTASCILAEDTADGHTKRVVYLTGQFNQNVVSVGPGVNINAVKDALRRFCIFLSESQAKESQ